MELMAKEADRLVSASSPAAERIEVHQTSFEEGMARMRRVETLPLQERARVEFAPGGTHFMLIGLTAPLEVGTRFPLELRFENAGTIVLDVEVMAADADHSHH